MLVRRKRDQKMYSWCGTTGPQPNFSRRGPCVYLIPVWGGRRHYKTEARFYAEYTREDGSPLR